jgi:hypothetical protein
MKNLTLILFVLISLNSISQIKTNGYIEIGYLDEKISLNEAQYITRLKNENSMYSEFLINFNFKNFNLEQELYNIFIYPGEGTSFKPLEIKFRTKLYYKIKMFDIGLEHICMHPIISQHNEIQMVTRRQSQNKIFIRFNFGNN